jgi:cell division septation protein DedD
MNSKNLLTTLLYTLLGLLLLVVGYKACQLRKEKEASELEKSKFDQELRDMGYEPTDTSQSTFVGDKGSAKYKDGSTEAPTQTPPNPVNQESGIESDVKTKAASSQTEETDEEGEKVRVTDLDAEFGMVDKPKYMVITGSFRQLANARKSMETLVKKGYTDAEVGKFNKGTYACAIAKRTNNINDANALVKKLKSQGFADAFVKTRK